MSIDPPGALHDLAVARLGRKRGRYLLGCGVLSHEPASDVANEVGIQVSLQGNPATLCLGQRAPKGTIVKPGVVCRTPEFIGAPVTRGPLTQRANRAAVY